MSNRNFLELRIIEYGTGVVLFKSRAQLDDDEELKRLFNNVRLRDEIYLLSESEKNRAFLFEQG